MTHLSVRGERPEITRLAIDRGGIGRPPIVTPVDLRISDDPTTASAVWIARRLRDSVRRRGTASLAVSGGSTAPPMFDVLVTLDVPWASITIWQVDERIAPDGDPDRNAGQLEILPARAKPMPVTSSDLRAAAARYGRGLPERFDVVHLGMGPDGHTASWPPGHEVMDSDRPVEVIGEFNGRERMTLTPPVVNAARSRVMLTHGDDKAELIERWMLRDPALAGDSTEADRNAAVHRPGGCVATAVVASAAMDATPNVPSPLSLARPAEPDRTAAHDCSPTDPGRADRYVVDVGDLRVDYSKQAVDAGILSALFDFARASGVEARRDAMFAGEHINTTEDRAVMHVALRAPVTERMEVDGSDVVPQVHAVLDQMAAFAERIRDDESITHVVNIGIGGSDLGPAMATRALAAYAHPRIRSSFVSNIDGADIAGVLDRRRSGIDAVHRRVQDVRHDRDPDQRAYGTGLARRGAR